MRDSISGSQFFSKLTVCCPIGFPAPVQPSSPPPTAVDRRDAAAAAAVLQAFFYNDGPLLSTCQSKWKDRMGVVLQLPVWVRGAFPPPERRCRDKKKLWRENRVYDGPCVTGLPTPGMHRNFYAFPWSARPINNTAMLMKLLWLSSPRNKPVSLMQIKSLLSHLAVR